MTVTDSTLTVTKPKNFPTGPKSYGPEDAGTQAPIPHHLRTNGKVSNCLQPNFGPPKAKSVPKSQCANSFEHFLSPALVQILASAAEHADWIRHFSFLASISSQVLLTSQTQVSQLPNFA